MSCASMRRPTMSTPPKHKSPDWPKKSDWLSTGRGRNLVIFLKTKKNRYVNLFYFDANDPTKKILLSYARIRLCTHPSRLARHEFLSSIDGKESRPVSMNVCADSDTVQFDHVGGAIVILQFNHKFCD